MDYRSVRFNLSPCSEDMNDLMAAFLADAGYESFEPDSTGLTAYIQDSEFNEDDLKQIAETFPFSTDISYISEFIKGVDWNEEWEKNYFKPILVADKCVVRSSFHDKFPQAEIEIVIDPKMAFGTGHHSTTSLMLSYLLDLQLKGKKILDMGTGTGILAILALKRGAKTAIGIEIDRDAFENSIDNGKLNGVNVDFRCGDASLLSEFSDIDIFIANINRNVITSDIKFYSKTLKDGGVMLLSGFYEEDIPIVEEAALKENLHLEEVRTDKNWAALRLKKISCDDR